jgi:hypothetical protein
MKFIKKHYHWVAPLLIGLIFFIIALPKIRLDFNILIQIAIFVALFWYSFETRELKFSSKFSNELEQRPIVDLYLRDPDEKISKEHFALRNIGKGVAYDVEVESIEIDDYKYKFYFDQANSILAPLKDEKPLKMITYTPDSGLIAHDIKNFKNHFSPQSLIVTNDLKNKFVSFLIKYKNISGEKYYSLFKFYSRHPLTEEFTIEFIKGSEGDISKESAYKLCMKILKKETIYER